VGVLEWIGAHLPGPFVTLYRTIRNQPRPDSGRVVQCSPSTLDLQANDPPKQFSILVSRPDLGHLIREFSLAATLYDNELVVELSDAKRTVSRVARALAPLGPPVGVLDRPPGAGGHSQRHTEPLAQGGQPRRLRLVLDATGRDVGR
jgi:hypothetical protein